MILEVKEQIEEYSRNPEKNSWSLKEQIDENSKRMEDKLVKSFKSFTEQNESFRIPEEKLKD